MTRADKKYKNPKKKTADIKYKSGFPNPHGVGSNNPSTTFPKNRSNEQTKNTKRPNFNTRPENQIKLR